jgi:hypothetical protein
MVAVVVVLIGSEPAVVGFTIVEKWRSGQGTRRGLAVGTLERPSDHSPAVEDVRAAIHALCGVEGFEQGVWVPVPPSELFQGQLGRLEAVEELEARSIIDVIWNSDGLRVRLREGV